MKIKISILWLFFLPVILVFHLGKVFLFLFVLMSIHESMHLLIAKKFAYRIEQIVVYPFGLCASIACFEYKDSVHEILITLAGLSVHIIFYFILKYSFSFVSASFLKYMQNANIALLLFNSLPIYPLDGGRIFRNVLEFFLPFKKAKYYSLFCSMFFFVLSMYFLYFTKVQILFFMGVFVLYYGICFAYFHEDIHAFYVYRFFHPVHKAFKIHQKNDLYKNHTNVYMKNGCMQSEKDVLRRWI